MSMREKDKEGEPEMKREKHSQREGEEDRLTDLPDCILLHIMKFMKTKYAVQTCILSKRWKDLWKLLPNLTLHSSDFNKLAPFKKYVSKVLSCRDGSVALESLDFDRAGFVEPQLLKRIARYAVSHNVQRLTIDVNFNDNLEIPPCIFSCHSITFLKIHLRRFGRAPGLPKYLVLPALTSLHLVNVKFSASDDDCAEPFSDCKKLRTLVIDSCFCRDTQVLFISNAKLANLTINSLWRNKTYKIMLSTPNLSYFEFKGHSSHQLSGCNLSVLEEVKIDLAAFSWKEFRETSLLLISFLQVLANVKLLTLSWTTLKIVQYIREYMSFQPPCFSNLKSLKVKKNLYPPTLMREESWILLDYLLQNSPAAEINIINC